MVVQGGGRRMRMVQPVPRASRDVILALRRVCRVGRLVEETGNSVFEE